MSGRYNIGEAKVRPGVYFHESSASEVQTPGAVNGIVAVAFQANWGPLGKVMSLTDYRQITEIYGTDGNVKILDYIFRGGASEIRAVRVGSGGTQAAITLKDTAATAADVVTLTAKYAGTRALSVTIKDSLSVSTLRECIIYADATELTKVTFAKGTDEVNALIEALNGNSASVVTAVKVAAGNGTLAAVSQAAFTTAGVSPTVTNADYSNAFTLLEASSWNTLCVDSNDTSVHALVAAFIERANDSGLMGMAVIGEPVSVAFATRKADAAAFNSPNVIYVANGFTLSDDGDVDGWKAAALIAGYVAYLPASDSVTHKVVPGATGVVGALTNTEIIQAIESGCIVFTVSASGNVWIEQGVNTLVTLAADQDRGWKKIRRTKTRYELIDRVNIATENIVGSVGNDSNGRATFIAAANGVIGAMVAENKLIEGSVTENPAYTPEGDSAWFVIDVRDLDSIEHIYINYLFHFGED